MSDIKRSKKKMRLIKWIILNLVMYVIMYFALFKGHAGATNVIKFAICLHSIIGLMVYYNDEARAKMKSKGPIIPNDLNLFIGIITACIFAYHGWFGFATLNFIGDLAVVAIYGDAKKGREYKWH